LLALGRRFWSNYLRLGTEASRYLERGRLRFRRLKTRGKPREARGFRAPSALETASPQRDPSANPSASPSATRKIPVPGKIRLAEIPYSPRCHLRPLWIKNPSRPQEVKRRADRFF
jgi:hypothetical protein